MARPTKFNPEIAQKILRLLMIGMTFEESARAVGVCRETVWAWRKKGEAQKRGQFREFLNGVEKAIEQCKVNALGVIEMAMRGEKATRVRRRYRKGELVEEVEEQYWLQPPQWTAAAWRLERLDPERWGRRSPETQINIQQNSVVQHVQQLQTMTREELEAKKLEFAEANRRLIEGPGHE